MGKPRYLDSDGIDAKVWADTSETYFRSEIPFIVSSTASDNEGVDSRLIRVLDNSSSLASFESTSSNANIEVISTGTSSLDINGSTNSNVTFKSGSTTKGEINFSYSNDTMNITIAGTDMANFSSTGATFSNGTLTVSTDATFSNATLTVSSDATFSTGNLIINNTGVYLNNLPTTDPNNDGQLWVDFETLKVSRGPIP